MLSIRIAETRTRVAHHQSRKRPNSLAAKPIFGKSGPSPVAAILTQHNSGAAISGLDWWARDRPVGTEHAAIPRLRLKLLATALAVIEELASIRRHLLRRAMAAGRTGDDRFQEHAAVLQRSQASSVHSIADFPEARGDPGHHGRRAPQPPDAKGIVGTGWRLPSRPRLSVTWSGSTSRRSREPFGWTTI